jgi:hypothetical protein
MAESAASGHAFCPFCGGELLPGQDLSEDHVFGRALGGRVAVMAHRTCNSQIGSAAEGDLQRPNTLVNLIKAVQGLPASRVEGTFPSGRPAFLNLKDGSVQSPPTVVKAADGTSLRIEGLPDEAENAFNKWRARHPNLDVPDFKDLPPGSISTVSYATVNVNLVHPLPSAEVVAAKSALAACVLAYGPTFAVSKFAAALRALQDGPADPQREKGDPALLDWLDTYIPTAAARAGLGATGTSGLPRLVPVPGETVHDVILVPIRGQRTLLFAHYLSELIPPYGIMVDARLPPLTPGLPASMPILLRDGGARDRLEVTDFTQRLMQPAIDALADAADGDIAQLGG